MTVVTPRDLWLANKAKRAGAKNSLRIIIEARRYNVPISLAFAVAEQESNFRNVFGHDQTTSIPDSWKGQEVTKSRYEYYRKHRVQHGAQGVGPFQLTSPSLQDIADTRGGAWIPKNNISTGLTQLAWLLRKYSNRAVAIARYNGSGPAADKYAEEVLDKQRKWHKVFS